MARATMTDYEEAAIQHFGTTKVLKRAGFVLEDGTMLDFSVNGIRCIDHRDIAAIMDDETVHKILANPKAPAGSATPLMHHFMYVTNAMRSMDGHGFEVGNGGEISRAQAEVMLDALVQAGSLYVDIYIYTDMGEAHSLAWVGLDSQESATRRHLTWKLMDAVKKNNRCVESYLPACEVMPSNPRGVCMYCKQTYREGVEPVSHGICRNRACLERYADDLGWDGTIEELEDTLEKRD